MHMIKLGEMGERREKREEKSEKRKQEERSREKQQSTILFILVKMKIANNTANTKKRKGIADQSSCKRGASKHGAKMMHATMKATRDLLFSQAINLMHDSENGPVKRAAYGSMQVAIEFLALHGHAGIEPYQIAYYRNNKMNKPPVPDGRMFPQTAANTDMCSSTHEQKTAASTEVSSSVNEQKSHAIDGLLSLARDIAPPAAMGGIMIDSTSKSG